MASVKVAVRVRPLNEREKNLESDVIVEISGKTITVTNYKVPEHTLGDQHREHTKDFTFDHSYWSVNPSDSHYVSQEQVFNDLGLDIIDCAYEGYNACVFAYGQTGSGKTYTMTGNDGDPGLIPRISNGLFQRMTDETKTYRTEVSYLEIYNETVRDLLPSNANKANQALKVREHPKDGPYVEDLSHHIVSSYADMKELLDLGNKRRTTAFTNMNDESSRSHSIFTIAFTQARFSKHSPSETYSRICLVDLAGSERADATGNTGIRLKEGGSINKSLVTLGNVISTLADMCDRVNPKRSIYIPYRESKLTWLLKDNLGGNAKTIMISTISPAACNYGETVSTLRYANRAKNIINKPQINEDPNVKLIRELRAEIARLRALLGGNVDDLATPEIQEQLNANEAKVKVLTEEWTGRWKEAEDILKEGKALALRKLGPGVVLDSDLPHLIGIDDDLLSTGIILYHLKEGLTTIGTETADEKQDIVLQGLDIQPEHCVISNVNDEVSLAPMDDSECIVNGITVTSSVILSQGDVIMLGKTNMFRFNHPLQASKLRNELKESNTSLSRMSLLSQSMLEIYRSTENLSAQSPGWDVDHREQLEALERKRREVEEMEEKLQQAEFGRQAKQRAEELELERKKHLLLEMQREAEKMKREAEQVQKQVKEEVTELRQKTLDLETQLKQYQQLGFVDNKGFEQCVLSFKSRSKTRNSDAAKDGVLDQTSPHSDLPQDAELELNAIDKSIQLLKKLQLDYNCFDSVAPELDDSIQSQIHSEIQQMDHLLTKIADLKFAASDEYEKKKREIFDQNNASLTDLENQISAISEAEIKIAEEINSLKGASVDGEALSELENRQQDIVNRKKELVLARDAAQVKLIQEMEELEGLNHVLLKDMEAAINEVTEHEVVYQSLISAVLEDNESKREGLLKMMKGKGKKESADVWIVGEDEEESSTENGFDWSSATDTVRIKRDDEKKTISDVNETELPDKEEMNQEQNKDLTVVEAESHLPSASEVPVPANTEVTVNPEECRQTQNEATTDTSDLKSQVSGDTLVEAKDSTNTVTNSSLSPLHECPSETDKLNHVRKTEMNGVRKRILDEGGRCNGGLVSEQKQREQAENADHPLRYSNENSQSSSGSDVTEIASNTSSALENFPVANAVDRAAMNFRMSSTASSNPFRIKIPSSVHRGSGFSSHVEYEVKIVVYHEEWTIFRRYRRFHQLHSDLVSRYPKVLCLQFPPKKFFMTEKVVEGRRIQLEIYLQKVLDLLYVLNDSPLHPRHSSVYCKQMLCNFHQFFQKGIFETTKHSAC